MVFSLDGVGGFGFLLHKVAETGIRSVSLHYCWLLNYILKLHVEGHKISPVLRDILKYNCTWIVIHSTELTFIWY
jgi:hypothetical protein